MPAQLFGLSIMMGTEFCNLVFCVLDFKETTTGEWDATLYQISV
jgi:hypothetical protein